MADRKPPHLATDERDTLIALLQFQRESVVRKVEGLDDAAAARGVVSSGTTVLWLVEHLADAEAIWLEERLVGRARTVAPATGTLAGAVERYRRTWATSDGIVAAADLDQESVWHDNAGSHVNLRWVLAHLLEETARHAGHADILRELEDGETGR
jgi:uncharacterized damage-inducible protein DinB